MTEQNAQLNRVNGLYSRGNDPVVVKMSFVDIIITFSLNFQFLYLYPTQLSGRI